MGLFLGLALLFLVCAGSLIVAAVLVSRGERELARDGVTTTGTVIATEYHDHGGFLAKVELSTPTGRRTFSAPMRRDGYQVGQTVPVRYLADRPESAAIDSGKNVYRRTILAISLSVGFAIAAGMMFAMNAVLPSR